MSFKKLIWKITPNAVHGLLREVYFILQLIPATWYDYLRFLRYSGLNKSHRYRNEQAARITMTYHQIEKGLSLATPRPGFGKEVIDRLFTALSRSSYVSAWFLRQLPQYPHSMPTCVSTKVQVSICPRYGNGCLLWRQPKFLLVATTRQPDRFPLQGGN